MSGCSILSWLTPSFLKLPVLSKLFKNLKRRTLTWALLGSFHESLLGLEIQALLREVQYSKCITVQYYSSLAGPVRFLPLLIYLPATEHGHENPHSIGIRTQELKPKSRSSKAGAQKYYINSFHVGAFFSLAWYRNPNPRAEAKKQKLKRWSPRILYKFFSCWGLLFSRFVSPSLY